MEPSEKSMDQLPHESSEGPQNYFSMENFLEEYPDATLSGVPVGPFKGVSGGYPMKFLDESSEKILKIP